MSGARTFRRSLCAAATAAALQLFASGPSANADVRINDFEPPLGSGVQGWFGYNQNIAPIGTVTNPVGGAASGSWMYITLESGTWVTAGPTIQPWANSNFSDAAFQANNYLQFDVILPSMDGANAVGYPSEGWISGATGTLGFGIESAVTSGGTAVPDLGSVNIGSLDVVQHVVLNYSTLKSSGGGAHFIDGWMNLLVDHPDETIWTNAGQTFIPQIYFDNIYLTMTPDIPLPLPSPADGTWDNTKSGDWVNAGNTNWVGGIAANGTLNSATFPQAAALRTVNTNVPGLALGTINLNSTNGYSITGSALTLGGGTPTVNVTAGNNTIASVILNSASTFSVAQGSSLAISDLTTGGFQSVNKTGLGAMSVNQINFVSLSADGSFTITNGPDNGFIFAITGLSPDAYIDLGNNKWRTNGIYGQGTIKFGGPFLVGLYGDGTFDGNMIGAGSLGVGSLGEGDADHVTTLNGNNTFSGGVTVYRGTLVAKNLRTGPMIIGDPAAAGGTVSKVQISAKTTANDPAGTSVVTSLTISGAGQLDLTNNSMVIDYTGPVGTLVADTRANIVNSKIISSSADASHMLGYGDNAVLNKTSFGGQNVDASSLLIKFTYGGDANLDGQVDVTDLGSLATNWQTSAPWTGGDFNYDGFVDVSDLGVLATNWQLGVGSPLGAGSLQAAMAAVGLGGVSVPEPMTFGLIAIGAWSLMRPRRRN